MSVPPQAAEFPGACCPSITHILFPFPPPPAPLPPPSCILSRLPPSWWSSENGKQSRVWRGENTEECKVYLCLPSESFFSSLFSHSHCSLDFDETAPPVAAAARCRGRHFPLMSAFQMPILCVILVKWRTVLSAGDGRLFWNLSV